MLDTKTKVLMKLQWQWRGNFYLRFWAFYFEWFYDGADFEHQILPAYAQLTCY